MNEEMAEKTIARSIQMMYKNLLQTGEEIHTMNNQLDNVAYRDEKSSDPSKSEAQKAPSEPQNITEALERLTAVSNNVLRDTTKLRERIGKLF
jgi:hypothetical protein